MHGTPVKTFLVLKRSSGVWRVWLVPQTAGTVSAWFCPSSLSVHKCTKHNYAANKLLNNFNQANYTRLMRIPRCSLPFISYMLVPPPAQLDWFTSIITIPVFQPNRKGIKTALYTNVALYNLVYRFSRIWKEDLLKERRPYLFKWKTTSILSQQNTPKYFTGIWPYYWKKENGIWPLIRVYYCILQYEYDDRAPYFYFTVLLLSKSCAIPLKIVLLQTVCTICRL